MGKTPTRESKLATYAIVIVGDYEAIEGNAYGLILEHPFFLTWFLIENGLFWILS
jgi:hypothetical protein